MPWRRLCPPGMDRGDVSWEERPRDRYEGSEVTALSEASPMSGVTARMVLPLLPPASGGLARKAARRLTALERSMALREESIGWGCGDNAVVDSAARMGEAAGCWCSW